ncbi:MAG: hypothetical protein ACRD9Q_07360, partial [Nitrososphaeraceae archaeon]
QIQKHYFIDVEISAKRIEKYCSNCFEKSGILLTATNGIDETMAVRENQKSLKERTRNNN